MVSLDEEQKLQLLMKSRRAVLTYKYLIYKYIIYRVLFCGSYLKLTQKVYVWERFSQSNYCLMAKKGVKSEDKNLYKQD